MDQTAEGLRGQSKNMLGADDVSKGGEAVSVSLGRPPGFGSRENDKIL